MKKDPEYYERRNMQPPEEVYPQWTDEIDDKLPAGCWVALALLLLLIAAIVWYLERDHL